MRFLWTPITVIIASGILFGIFQNCTPAVPYGNTNYLSELVASKTFPYDIGFDQIAYMSCSEQDNITNDGTFFTFRVAAIEDLGLRVNQTFRDEIDKLTDEEVVSALRDSMTSSGTRIQLGIRSMDNLQLMYVDSENGASGIDGLDYNNFFPGMGNPDLSSLLWYMEPGDYLREWAGAQFTDEYRFSGQLSFMKSQNMEYRLRSFFNDSGVITVTFAESGKIQPLGPGSFVNLAPVLPNLGTPTPPTTPEGPNNKLSAKSSGLSMNLAQNVFGMAIKPSFKQPLPNSGGSPGADMPPRILGSITEISIDDRSTQPDLRPWVCPANMYFKIVLPEHANYKDGQGRTVTVCAMNSDPINPSAALKRVRQSLYAEDWYVDMTRRCIVPKPGHTVQGSCYGINSSTQETHLVNYQNFATTGCGFGKPSGLCPHYASICYRQ